MDLYYYVDPNEPEIIRKTQFLGELISLIFAGRAQMITPEQAKKLKLPADYQEKLRATISHYEERVPLYDISYNHIFLVYKNNVYPRIIYDNYRFVDRTFYESLLNLEKPFESDRENLRILSYYDLDILQQTYFKIFYESFVVNEYITSCRRPSFRPGTGMDHIQPYYNIDELYYLAYDWNLIDRSNLSTEEINILCKQIATYDIPADILMEHQLYIYRSRAIGLVKHYSLYGSYYMNLYLRKYFCCLLQKRRSEKAIRNSDLENQIRIMISLIRRAPPFTKKYTVYRFIHEDSFLGHLRPGDLYQEPAFVSTTRNPFYYQENYAFGYILMKIELPENVAGIGLCIESYSNFPKEEEIILPPTTRYRIKSVIDIKDAQKYHHILNKRVVKKYELVCLGNDYCQNDQKIVLEIPDAQEPEIVNIDVPGLVKNQDVALIPMIERLHYFNDKFVNVNHQFRSTIEGTQYIFNVESYDSSTVYQSFFYFTTPNGLMITSANPKYGNINILLEIDLEIHVNYYFKYSVNDPSRVVNLDRDSWIKWLSCLAYLLGSRKVIIHPNYVLHHDQDENLEDMQIKTRYTFSENIYQYLKNHKKYFSEFPEIIPAFDYGQLDILKNISVDMVAKPTDTDEIYHLSQISGSKNVCDLYIYIVEKFPKLLRLLEDKMMSIYSQDELNPFKNIYYTLDPWTYLYNHQLILRVPEEHEFVWKQSNVRRVISEKKIRKFKNRLRTYLANE